MDPDPPITATERAYRWTKEAILGGSMAGGTLITEGEVASLIDVSRTPVREAFLRLQADGLLTLHPKRGARVVPVTPHEVSDVIGARNLLEPWAFEQAADQDDAAGVARELDRWVDVQAERLGAGDEAGFREADRAFHSAGVAAAGNALITAFYRSLRDRQARMGTSPATGTPRAEEIVAEHRSIADAVRHHDAAEAAARVRDHVGKTAGALRAGDGGVNRS